MTKTLFLASSCLLGAFTFSLLQCSSSDDGDPNAPPPVPQECGDEPSKNPTCTTDALGVFVSPSGNDNGSGTRTEPVKSVGKAIEKSGNKPFVFVCEGNYPEALTIGRGMGVYGGLSCNGSWDYTGGATSVVPPSGIALTIANADKPVTIADMSFTSAGASAAGESSLGAWFAQSNAVALRRVNITAGAGADATKDRPTIPAWTPATAPKGNDADSEAPGPAQPHPCEGLVTPNDKSTGGAGGGRDEDGGAGAPPVLPPTPTANTGAGGDTHQSCPKGAGIAGSFGAGGRASPEGGGFGRMNAAGYVAADGVAGGNGGTAQGGGGGAGRNGSTAFGGGGGAGGCGGKGGAGGRAGGSSIALLVYRTPVTLTGSKLHASKGGVGGPGGTGQVAQQGGTEGKGYAGPLAVPGCAGASGGHGGSGAGGNGGAGGSSIDVAYTGTAPTIDGAQVSVAASFANQGWTLSPSASAGGSAGDAGQKVVTTSASGESGRAGPQGQIQAVAPLLEGP